MPRTAPTQTHPSPVNWLRFLSLPFGALLTWGALQKLLEVNLASSFDHWGSFIAGLFLLITPFLMSRFLTCMLIAPGIFAVANMLHPKPESWLLLLLFVLLTVLIFQPYPLLLRIFLQLLALAAVGGCLWFVWQDFYSGLDHFIQTGKLTNDYLQQRIRIFIPQHFSYDVAVIFLILSIRQKKQKHAAGDALA